jgi:hypothetical protein
VAPLVVALNLECDDLGPEQSALAAQRATQIAYTTIMYPPPAPEPAPRVRATEPAGVGS